MKIDTANFLETLLFVADSPDHETRPFRDSSIHEFHPDFIAAVDYFIAGFRDYLATNHPDLDPDAGERSFGGNCYFSLSGHGCGFWDDSDMEWGKAMHAALKAYSASLLGGERWPDLRFHELESNLSKRRGGKIDLAYMSKYLPAYRLKMFGQPEPVTPPRKGTLEREVFAAMREAGITMETPCDVIAYELTHDGDSWSVNTPFRIASAVSGKAVLEAARARWEVFKVNYSPRARVSDLTDTADESGIVELEVDYLAFLSIRACES